MGVWRRLKRSVRAIFGGFVEKTENPELILQQTIQDMKEKIPELNNNVAYVMSHERLLSKKKDQYSAEVVDFDAKIKAAVKMGRDDIATTYIGQLQQAQLNLQKTTVQLEQAAQASKQALKARDNYRLQLERRSAEALQLINASRQAKLQEQLAQTMETFNLGDDAATFNEMREKIDRRVATAEAKLQLGTSSVDAQMQDIEHEAMQMQLQDKLLEYKAQMGMLPGAKAGDNLLSAGQATSGNTSNKNLLTEANET
jgi:phage shock protein A